MQYLHETEPRDYSDLASGRVLYNQKGATAFPVRLASEIFLRALDYLRDRGTTGPIEVYDPCCGSGYLLTTLAFLHAQHLSRIVASDVDPDMVCLARRNLALLTSAGIDNRIREINSYLERFGKDSHKRALEAANRLNAIRESRGEPPEIQCFQADALERLRSIRPVDLVLSDLPYGRITRWSGGREDSTTALLDNLLRVLKPVSIVAVVTAKEEKIKHPGYHRIKHLAVGRRRVTFLESHR
jgi:23S rRNA G2445 N2-methylase RlmL